MSFYSYLINHIDNILVALGMLGLAIINSMPAKCPSSFAEVYSWLRDSLQTAIPINRRTINPPTPTESLVIPTTTMSPIPTTIITTTPPSPATTTTTTTDPTPEMITTTTTTPISETTNFSHKFSKW